MKTAVLFALTFVGSSHAYAQEFTGATIYAERLSQTLDGWEGSGEIDTFRGDLEFRMGAFVVQGGITEYSSEWQTDVSSLEVHFGYKLNDALTVAVFGVREDWEGYFYEGVGAELAYELNRWSGEVWFKHEYADFDSDYGADVFSTTIEYNLTDRFSVLGRFVNNQFDGDPSSERFVRLGGSMQVTDGLSTDLYFEKMATDSGWLNEMNNLGFALRYDFGNGVTFGNRSYLDYFHATPMPM